MITVLNAVNISRSTYYNWKATYENEPILHQSKIRKGYSYNKTGEKILDIQIQKYISEIYAGEFEKCYGYKRITVVLQEKYSLKIGKNKVYDLMNMMKLLKKKNPKTKGRRRICENHIINQSNQLWELDTKYIYIAQTRQIAYLASIIDVFDRSIVGFELSLSANAESANKALFKALYARKIIKNTNETLILRTDNGSQFIALKFEEVCIGENIIHERIPVASPNFNAHIESYHKSLQTECLASRMFKNLEDANNVITRYVDWYNKTRLHSSIKYMTPTDFYNCKNQDFKSNFNVSL